MTAGSGFRVALSLVVLLVACVAISPEARAGGVRGGLYASGNVGATFPSASDFEITTNDGVVVRSGNTSFGTGFSINGALGYGFRNLRVEGEVSWRQIEVDSLQYDTYIDNGVPLSRTILDGVNRNLQHEVDASLLGLMANAWYDFDTGTNWMPFIGGGLGTMRIHLDAERVQVAGSDPISHEETDWVFAYQAGAGMGYSLSDAVVLQLGYRYLRMSASEYGNWTAPGLTLAVDLQEAHNAEVGIRYRF